MARNYEAGLGRMADGRSRGNFEAIRDANRADGLQIDPLTVVPRWGGEEMGSQLAVLELIQRE